MDLELESFRNHDLKGKNLKVTRIQMFKGRNFMGGASIKPRLLTYNNVERILEFPIWIKNKLKITFKWPNDY